LEYASTGRKKVVKVAKVAVLQPLVFMETPPLPPLVGRFGRNVKMARVPLLTFFRTGRKKVVKAVKPVLKDIRRILAEVEIDQSKFAQVYKAGNGQLTKFRLVALI